MGVRKNKPSFSNLPCYQQPALCVMLCFKVMNALVVDLMRA